MLMSKNIGNMFFVMDHLKMKKSGRKRRKNRRFLRSVISKKDVVKKNWL